MVVSEGTLNAPDFSECGWKKCPSDVHDNRKYVVGEKNPRVATKINRGRFGKCCTIIGNTYIPPNKVTSWSIKILKSRDNDGDDIYVGVAPFDINQDDGYKKCGWYFYCYYSELCSGPPYNYSDKEYGPRNGWGGRYVHTGDSIGVVVDTGKGELSFILNGVNRGVAYEGIPLDKPLVPCVLLYYQGDSVELNIPKAKKAEVVIIIPAESTTWDSITLTWDKVEGASSYQIEVDGSNCGEPSTVNTFIKRDFLPDTEHSFRVRIVKGNSLGEWSDAVKVRTQKIPIPSGITAKSSTWDTVTLTWDKVEGASSYQIEVDESKSWDTSTTNTFTKRGLLQDTEHSFRVRTVGESSVSGWCGIVKGRTLKKSYEGAWMECPDDVDDNRKYVVDEKNPRTATKTGRGWCTIIGNTHIPLNKVTSWSIKVLKSMNNNGDLIYIGVEPFDINQNVNCNDNNGWWYFYCYWSTLHSGPPHYYRGKEYRPRKHYGQYVHTGDSVGVVIDTTKGELSFVLDGVNRGVAFEGIPLDKPLVPCVALCYPGDSVELDISEVKENADSSVPVPSNIVAKSITCDIITFTWDEVDDALFYQIEVDGSKFWNTSTTTSFTKRGLLPETMHSFRVRTVRESSAGEWSGIVEGRTLKAPEFSGCAWKECPSDVDNDRKYSVDEKNPRVATNINDGYYCVIIGNTPIPLNKVTQWNVKVLKSRDNDGSSIYIGIAPSDINQNGFDYEHGWYFYCYSSSLWSGPPHKYSGKEYGPRKGSNEQYVHTGDSVGVVVDTTRGDLSFVLNGVNRGVAYCGIPLDKPFVPCVFLKYKDSIELII